MIRSFRIPGMPAAECGRTFPADTCGLTSCSMRWRPSWSRIGRFLQATHYQRRIEMAKKKAGPIVEVAPPKKKKKKRAGPVVEVAPSTKKPKKAASRIVEVAPATK